MPPAQSAQPAGPAPTAKPGPAPVDEASKLYQEGNAAQKKGDLAGAEAAYLKAWALTKTFDVASSLGLVELQLKKYREAAEFLAFGLRSLPPSTKQAQRESTRQSLEQAKKQVLTVRLTLSLPEAAVSVDGQRLSPEMVASEIFVVPGKHLIEASFADHEPASSTIDGTAGTAVDAVLTLKEKPRQEPVAAPTLPSSTPPPPPPRSPIPIYVLGGAAVVALGVGIGLNASAASDDGSVKTTSEDILAKKRSCVPGASNFDARCTALESQAQNAQTLSGVSVGLMVGALVLAGGAAVYWFLPGAAPVKFGAAVLPENGRVSGAINVGGRF